ncbi:SET domain-containing protein-lysine N-methyltransferase [Variovorax sp. J22P168]|uniref:SET domain-containing protein n=1 Tax=Variovorax jilinensis TaxID=3053513 RepID=UPI002574B2FC|nr:SET domain-containing protein-lysine N-methyltransferase [Variovorax sp. J22P168]MDM0014151.1 SET domain-containing protein-lysine N-methyltransferase [Variovorax sp. J22P168]
MPSKSPSSGGRRIQTRRSSVHGNGVFAVQDIAEGETLIEYKGEVINWEEALRRHPHDPSQPHHTFYFHIDEDRVIDGNVNGNAARWINHSCDPSCEADEQGGRIFIKALRNIAAGEELSYDYGLVIDEPYTKKLKADFPCWCGSADCRGTLLAPPDEKEDRKSKKARKRKDKQKAKDKAKAKAGKKDKSGSGKKKKKADKATAGGH